MQRPTDLLDDAHGLVGRPHAACRNALAISLFRSNFNRISIVLDLSNGGSVADIDLALDLRAVTIALEGSKAHLGQRNINCASRSPAIDLVSQQPDFFVDDLKLEEKRADVLIGLKRGFADGLEPCQFVRCVSQLLWVSEASQLDR